MFREIEDFYIGADGNDWYPAIMRAQYASRTSNLQNDLNGFTLVFRPRVYHFSRPVDLIRRMNILGSGSAFNGATVFQFDDGVSAIICHKQIWIPEHHEIAPDGTRVLIPGQYKTTYPDGAPADSDASIIERITLIGGWSLGSRSTAHGVILYARVILRDVTISQFGGDGIYINADNNGVPIEALNNEIRSTIANLWQIQNCSVDTCRNGLFVRGGDANAGCAIALNCSNNREWGIYDNSFLGNTYIACHTDSNRCGAYRCTSGVDGSSARSLFLNCYTEVNGELPRSHISIIQSPSMIIGGNLNYIEGPRPQPRSGEEPCPPPKRPGLWLDPGGFVESIRVIGKPVPPHPQGYHPDRVTINLGGAMPGVAMELHRPNPASTEDNKPYRLHYNYTPTAQPNSEQGWWELVYGNMVHEIPLRFSTEAAQVKQGQLWLENGFYIGKLRERLRIQVDGQLPSKGNKGDIILNPNPVAGGSVGWICITSSQDDPVTGNLAVPAVWHTFGQIDQAPVP